MPEPLLKLVEHSVGTSNDCGTSTFSCKQHTSQLDQRCNRPAGLGWLAEWVGRTSKQECTTRQALYLLVV